MDLDADWSAAPTDRVRAQAALAAFFAPATDAASLVATVPPATARGEIPPPTSSCHTPNPRFPSSPR